MRVRRTVLIVFTIATVFSLGGIQQADAAGIIYGLDGAAGQGTSLYTIDTSTGVATPIGATGFSGCGAMDYDTVGNKMYAICNNGFANGQAILVTINLTTGVGTLVATLSGASAPSIADMSFRNSDNTLFVIGGSASGIGPGTVFTLDKVTGVLTTLPIPTATPQGNGIAFSPADTLFHSAGEPTDSLGTIDQVLGARTLVAAHTFVGFPGGINLFPRMTAMDYMPGSGMLFGSLNDAVAAGTSPFYLVTVDETTAVVTHIGITVNRLDAIAFGPSGFGDFKCWINSVSQNNPPSTTLLEITDQFNQGGPPIVNNLWFPNDYCTAVEKNGQDSPFSPDLNQHYQLWFYPPSLEGPGTGITVNLEIPQFDDLNGIVIGNLDSIFVPATKDTGSGPQDSFDDQQHWNCYDLEFSNPPLPAPVDDFVTLVTQHFEQNADVLRPFLLCAPMIKFDGNNFFPDNQELIDEHMVCYDLENVTIEDTFENLPNTLIDQLGSNDFVANDVEALCVPAFKSFPIVGGSMIPIDTSALLLAGVQSISMWMIPVILAGIGIGVFVIKRRK